MIENVHLRGDDGRLLGVMQIVANPARKTVPTTVVGKHECRKLIEAMRHVPFDAAIVTVHYETISSNVLLNAPTEMDYLQMDLSHVYADREEAKKDALPTRMVAPLPNVVPEDSIVAFVTVENLKDVMDAPAQAVLLFPDHSMELLGMIVEHPTIMGFAPFVLSGLPTADYHAQFESKTYALNKVAYTSLVNDLVERNRSQRAIEEERETPYERERRQFTRNDGSVKELRNVKIAGRPDPVEPDDSVE